MIFDALSTLPKPISHRGTQDLMPPDPTPNADQPPSQSGFEKYLVLAEQMGIGGYQLAMTCAESEEDALELASSALEEGCQPLAAFTADELRQMADDLCARELPPRRTYNVTTDMTDEEMAAQDEAPDEE